MNTSPPIVVGLGEAVWDIFGDERKPGGATANVAYHAGQFGARGVVATRLGTDDAGRDLLAYFESKGLDTSALQFDADHETGKVTVDMRDPGHPTYVIHNDVAWDHLEPTESLMALADRADAVCFGSLAQRSPVARKSIREFIRRTKGLVVFDVNIRQRWYDRESLEQSFTHARVAKLNLDELPLVAAELGLASGTERAFAADLQSRFPVETVIVTRAEHGCFVARGGEFIDCPGETIQLVDAVGAGDAFSAAFIILTLEGHPLATVARFANRVGGLVASRSGAMPDVAEDYRRLRAEFGVEHRLRKTKV